MFKAFKKNVMTKKTQIAYLAMIGMMASEPVFASTNRLRTILNDPFVSGTITLGFSLYAAYEVFKFVDGFSLKTALQNIITPAFIIFLAFQWQSVFKWVGLM